MLMLAVPGAEDRPKPPPLRNAFEGEGPGRNIQRRAESGGKCEEFRMLESEDDCAEAAHGNSGDGAVFAVSCGREPLLHISNKVLSDVILVTVLGIVR